MLARLRPVWIIIICAIVAVTLTACGWGKMPVEVRVDGSSTVFPITEIMAYEFRKSHPDIRITIGVSGTGGGFKKWLRQETDINNASRPISEIELNEARAVGIEPLELPVALDGISIVVNEFNDWVECLTIEQLREIWTEGGRVQTWRDLDPSWPDHKIVLYGPGTDSGTFDYFNEVLFEPWDNSFHTTDFSASENDNVLVQGVIGDLYSLGYMGYAHYSENSDRLRAIPIDGGSGCVAPTVENIRSNTYSPLSRPVFLYVNRKALDRQEVLQFVQYYLQHAPSLVERAGFVSLPQQQYEEGLLEIAR